MLHYARNLPDEQDRASEVQFRPLLPTEKEFEYCTLVKQNPYLFSYSEVVNKVIITPNHEIAALA
jgi:hypothetical protein